MKYFKYRVATTLAMLASLGLFEWLQVKYLAYDPNLVKGIIWVAVLPVMAIFMVWRPEKNSEKN